jgi:hypothetical protein
MEQPLEQSLELVWSWSDFAFAGHGANIGAITGAGLELFRLCTRLSWSNRLGNHRSWSGAGVTLSLPVMERLMEQSLEPVWGLSDFAFLSCCDFRSNYWSWSGPGVTVPLPVME